MTEKQNSENKKKKNGKRIEWVTNLQVCYVPLPPEREEAWRAATLLLLEIIYPVLCKAGRDDPGELSAPVLILDFPKEDDLINKV